MQRELIKIDLSQLRPGAPVAREIYLKMPRNGKMLRIAWRSDELSPELLRRLQANPSAELYALPLDGDAEDAASLPLFGDLAKIRPTRDAASATLEPTLAAIKPERATSADDESEPLPASLEEILPKAKSDTTSEEARSRGDNFVNEDFVPADPGAPEEDLQNRRRKRDTFVEEESAIIAESGSDAPEKAFDTDEEDLYAREAKNTRDPETEEEGLLARRRREAAETLDGVKESESEEPPQESLHSRKRREAEEAFVAEPKEQRAPAEEESLLARKRREAEQAFARAESKVENSAEEGLLARKRREAEQAFAKDEDHARDPADEGLLARKRREAESALREEAEESRQSAFQKDPAGRTARKLTLVPKEEVALAIPELPNEPVPLPAVAENFAAVAKSYSNASGESHRNEVRLAALLDEASEELFRLSQGDESEEARFSLKNKLEECRTEISRQEREGAKPVEKLRSLHQSLTRVTTALAANTNDELDDLSVKLNESFEELRTTIAKEERMAAAALGKELSSVAEMFTAFAAGDTGGDEALFDLRERISACIDDTETRISADPVPDEELITIKASLNNALKALPYTSRAAKAYRDTPMIASRLAAQLAHSLGYASPAYLGDLALSTWLFFAEKSGAPIELQDPPPLVRAAQGASSAEETAGTPVGDVAAILAFLDRYFDNPDCDRTRKDFSPRTFESTLKELEQGVNPPDEFTAARWRFFVGKGLSMSGESLCSRASAKAAKIARAQVPRAQEA